MSGRDGGFTPTAEVDEALWLPVLEARAVLTYQRDVAILDAMVCPERESLRSSGTSALDVRTPGAGIETSYPHLATFTPDERAIGHGVRAMAGWLARRTR